MSRLVTVRWIDTENVIGWMDPDDIEGPEPMEASGYLVRDEPHWIAIATTVDDGQCNNVTLFPRGCVLDVRPS